MFCLVSSLYRDEDGHTAHEFYEEVEDKQSKKRIMQRKYVNLTPEVKYFLIENGLCINKLNKYDIRHLFIVGLGYVGLVSSDLACLLKHVCVYLITKYPSEMRRYTTVYC